MSNRTNPRRKKTKRMETETGQRFKNPGAGRNATHVARSRKKWKRTDACTERRTGHTTDKVKVWGTRRIRSENMRCACIADRCVPEYRAGKKSYSCTGAVAKRWEAAWKAVCMTLGYESGTVCWPSAPPFGDEVKRRCAYIADRCVPEYRAGKKSYSCTGTVAKRWEAAWKATSMTLGYDPGTVCWPPMSPPPFRGSPPDGRGC